MGATMMCRRRVVIMRTQSLTYRRQKIAQAVRQDPWEIANDSAHEDQK